MKWLMLPILFLLTMLPEAHAQRMTSSAFQRGAEAYQTLLRTSDPLTPEEYSLAERFQTFVAEEILTLGGYYGNRTELRDCKNPRYQYRPKVMMLAVSEYIMANETRWVSTPSPSPKEMAKIALVGAGVLCEAREN